jgi:hypothetical protein
MNDSLRGALARALALSMILCTTPGLLASDAASRLEGLVVGVDGRAATSLTVALIDERGSVIERSGVAADGLYSFRRIEPGSYWLGVETQDGLAAPVATPPVRLEGGELVRRDLKLLSANAARVAQATDNPNYGIGLWWAGLSPAAKVWVVIGIVTFAGITYAALDDEEDPASPSGGTN